MEEGWGAVDVTYLADMKYISGEEGWGAVDVTYLADMKYISGGGGGVQ